MGILSSLGYYKSKENSISRELGSLHEAINKELEKGRQLRVMQGMIVSQETVRAAFQSDKRAEVLLQHQKHLLKELKEVQEKIKEISL